MSRTLDNLLISLDSQLEVLRPVRIPTVFIGGGTPSLLPVDRFHTFLERLHQRIGRPEEFSIEVNPESLSREFLQMLSDSDVNRISMGVQTYDGGLLSWLGRPAGPEAVASADGLLDEHWKGRLSRDLLAALPGKPGRLLEDVRLALKNDPGHLSVYELTVEPGTPLAASPEDLGRLPGEEERSNEWNSLLAEMVERGYHRYEVSNFARPGEQSRHNLRYWRMNPYLGIGPGAVSTLPAAGGTVSAVRRENVSDLLKWLADPLESAVDIPLSPGELMLEHFMMALRTGEGLSRRNFLAVFQFDPLEAAPRALERWLAAGLLKIDKTSIAPTGTGMDFVDSILTDIASESGRPGFPQICLWPPP